MPSQHSSDGREEKLETKMPTMPTIEVVPPSEGMPKAPEASEAPKAPEAPAFGSFQVVVPTKGFSTLGLQTDLLEPMMPMILEIGDGAIQKFNKTFPGSSLKPYDVLESVDEATSWDDMETKISGELPDKMTVNVKRPRKVKVSFEKTGPVGMRLDYKNKSNGIVVKEIDAKGLQAAWNSQNVSDAIGIGDRIIEFDGQKCPGGELMNRLKKESKIIFTALKY